MTTRKTCDKCKHYTASDITYRDAANDGECALMGDSNEDKIGCSDRCRGWDYEGYSAGVYVGPKFSCIHWTKK